MTTLQDRYGDINSMNTDDGNYPVKPIQPTTLGFGQKFMKYTLIVINVLFLIFSIVLMASGAAAMNGAVNAIAGQTIPEGIIAVGVFILLLSLLGFVSAYKEYRIGLGIYFIFVSLFTVILLAVGIAVYVKKGDASYYLSQGWLATCNQTGDAANTLTYNCTASTTVQTVQNSLSCCGLNTLHVYAGANCPLTKTPCLGLMTSTFTNNFGTAGGVGIAFAVIMIVSLLFIGLLMRGIRITRNARQLEQLREKNYAANHGSQAQGINLPDNVL